MNRDQLKRGSAFTCGLLMLALAGCTTLWSDERQKHYAWLYEKCMRGQHEPYTIYMNLNHTSPLLQRCRAEYHHYMGNDHPSALTAASAS